jgi:hypothetical protein
VINKVESIGETIMLLKVLHIVSFEVIIRYRYTSNLVSF